jgi:hypothetical protein
VLSQTLPQLKRLNLILDNHDWSWIARLAEVMEIFTEATEHLSADRFPTMSEQLPYYSILCNQLHAIVEKEKDRNATLHDACAQGWKVLDTYHNKADAGSVYAITTMLDPRCKDNTFKKLGWKKTCIDAAHKNLKRVFTKEYTTTALSRRVNPVASIADPADEEDVHPSMSQYEAAVFESQNSLTAGAKPKRSEIERYFEAEVADFKVRNCHSIHSAHVVSLSSACFPSRALLRLVSLSSAWFPSPPLGFPLLRLLSLVGSPPLGFPLLRLLSLVGSPPLGFPLLRLVSLSSACFPSWPLGFPRLYLLSLITAWFPSPLLGFKFPPLTICLGKRARVVAKSLP